MVKNGHRLLGLETPKPAVSQEWVDKMSWFFHADTNLRKLLVLGKVWFPRYALSQSDYRIFKSTISLDQDMGQNALG